MQCLLSLVILKQTGNFWILLVMLRWGYLHNSVSILEEALNQPIIMQCHRHPLSMFAASVSLWGADLHQLVASMNRGIFCIDAVRHHVVFHDWIVFVLKLDLQHRVTVFGVSLCVNFVDGKASIHERLLLSLSEMDHFPVSVVRSEAAALRDLLAQLHELHVILCCCRASGGVAGAGSNAHGQEHKKSNGIGNLGHGLQDF
mmetsp:Transcript_32907/g.59370  ORF Transcript_32907/g.59370 Transcript_32907/m.59370 type:complete len:201 (-) Transcript_32907:59-661(-)